jgi:IS5 family transposase
MERELWPVLYRVVRAVGLDFSQKYVQIPGWVLVLTMLWAALHDRPVSWACDPGNWTTTRLRPARLPSAATMSRRIDTVGLGLLWRAVERQLRDRSAEYPALVAVLDGWPLPVGGATKDPDARYGRGAGVMAKGYKLHTVWAKRALPEAWAVTPMNTSEITVAKRLLPQWDYGGYLLADGNYDGNELFDLAWEGGYQLLTPAPGWGTGRGHRYHSPHRWRSIHLMRHTAFGPSVYRCRIAIEQAYGNAASFGGGLSPLPAWVRGLDRVRTWVWAKLLINAARILRNKHLRTARNKHLRHV